MFAIMPVGTICLFILDGQSVYSHDLYAKLGGDIVGRNNILVRLIQCAREQADKNTTNKEKESTG